MKEAIRSGLELLFRLFTLPLYVLWLVTGKSRSSFQTITHGICWIPGKFGSFSRIAFLKWVSPTSGRVGGIMTGTVMSHPGITIGNRSHVGAFCDLALVHIGDKVLMGSGVHVVGKDNHNYDRVDIPILDQGGKFSEIKIGSGSWIGNRCIVMADIGKECVVGAGAVVTNPLPDWSVAVGVPARVIRSRRATEQTEL
jgi:virginiamycin A acetyltransferase